MCDLVNLECNEMCQLEKSADGKEKRCIDKGGRERKEKKNKYQIGDGSSNKEKKK